MYRFFILTLFSAIIVSCGDSDPCVQSDWVGTYSGIETCDGAESEVTVRIFASGDNSIQINYETPTSNTFIDPAPFEECSISISSSEGITGPSLNASLDGDNLSITEISFNGFTNSICIIEAKRD